MHRLNLDHLHAFATVIEHGSFSAAAERLALTQPAVSLQVRQLEKRLGTLLIERVGRRATPTAAGTELLAHAARIDEAVGTALGAVGQHAAGVMGRVRLGTGATACIFLLPPLLRELRRRYPGLELTVTTGNTADIVKAIDENRIDVGLVTLPAAGRSLVVTPVLDDPFVVAAPRGTELPTRLTAAALARQPVLLFEPGGNTRRIVDAWFARAGVTLKPVMSLGSVEAIKALVAAGLGCAVLPQMAVRHEQARGSLVVRPLAPKLQRQLGVVVRRDKRLQRPLAETIRALETLAGTAPAAAP
ncbi:LysR family transcriptional regulator [Aquincola sp. S2]|uniref:LysR family transcriptional regulator n=1 Tax=Pseudaquabacterium terrae TaxID=2732868 RepID=A0ABX2EJK3_9BURK|nr:LysR family transcriptional regulator [Aquabacterium terrae]NRF68793.1 LysR family transcriptional regulator [Aquabacterium terrae]